MAKSKKNEESEFTEFGDIFSELKGAINKRVPHAAYILGEDDSPTDIKEWISLGSYQLDSIISNRADKGGAPVGRIIEIYGLESCGKSLLGISACIDTQKKGGIAVYIDSENATSLEHLVRLGVDPKKLVYVQVPIIEEVFEVIDTILTKLMEKYKGQKKPLVTIIIDSIAQCSSKIEYEAEYSDMQYAPLARALGKGIRKITQFLAASNATLICLNQLRMKMKLQNPYEFPFTEVGGKAIAFASSVIIKLDKSKKIEGDDDAILGFETKATIIKNKVGPPARKCTFDILFNQGVDDSKHILDFLKKKELINLISAQKSELILETGETIEFKNTQWLDIYDQHKEYIEKIVRNALVMDLTNPKTINRVFEYDPSALPENASFNSETGEVTLKSEKKQSKKEVLQQLND